MSSLDQQFQSVKNAIRRQHHRASETLKIRTVNTFKWKQSMLQALQDLAKHPTHDTHLIDDLKTVVLRIPEEKFIEAIINMQPYKPQFEMPQLADSSIHCRKSHKTPKFQLSPKKEGMDEATTTSSGSILKGSLLQELSAAKRLKSKQKLMATLIQEQVLAKEISSPNHPFAKISQGYSFILENKYKSMIEGQLTQNKLMSFDEFTQRLTKDFQLITAFFKMISDPIIDIFQLKEEKSSAFAEEIHNFIASRFKNSDKICTSLRKIVRYYIRNSIQMREFEQNCPLQAEIECYDIPSEFQIEGCFIYTTAELISFCEQSKAKELLNRLTSVRSAIYRDIDEYYTSSGKPRSSMEVSSAIQLEILKFCLVKLRIFGGEILGGMTLLSILHGEQEMAFHFDQASYIHSQLTIAFQAVQSNL